jgi:para-nitrobenzyl esterase
MCRCWWGGTPRNRSGARCFAAVVDSLYGADAGEALRLFPGATPQQIMESGTLLAGARFIAYSTWKWAELQHRTGMRPVFRYLFAHPRPATIAPAPSPPPAGAVHSAEIEYALGNLATNRVYAWTAEDDSLSAATEGFVAAFVKTGNPNGLGLPRWPAAYAGDSVRVMILDVPPHAGTAPHENAFRFLDAFYARTSTAAP